LVTQPSRPSVAPTNRETILYRNSARFVAALLRFRCRRGMLV
jgi:hypothetical protein